jgi:hypothetical protein
MKQEKFIKVLDNEGYSYEIVGDNIVVTGKGDIWLESLTSLPPGVEFKNGGGVFLESLTSLPPGVVFNNVRDVWLDSLTSLPPGVVFNNLGDVALNSLVGGWFENWKGNIEGIDSKRLLNLMIKQGVFI